MVLFNYSTKELTAKIVYYGPGLCGKTTNLQWVHEKIPIKNKGKMLSLATEADRTLFFDFLPIDLGTIRGMKTRVQLYTVPGQVFYNATRRMVLKGADCVVFVVDSQEPMIDANSDALANLRENLEANEIDPDQIPTVMQYNKRDLPNAAPIEMLQARLNPNGWPYFEAVAMKGQGVEETLKGATALVFKTLAGKYGAAPSRPALSKPAPPAKPAAPPPPAPEPEPPPLELEAPPATPAPPAADSLLDSLGDSAPAVIEETTNPALPIEMAVDDSSLDALAEPAIEPELDLEAAPEGDAAVPELDLDAGLDLDATPELSLEPEPAVEPELDLDAPAEPPELDLDGGLPDEPELDLGEPAPAEPELDLEAPVAEETELQLDDAPSPPSPEVTVPPSSATVPPAPLAAVTSGLTATSGVVNIEVPATVAGGEVLVPIRLNVAEGTTELQVNIRLTLKLRVEK